MMKKVLLVILLFCITQGCIAQIDTEFWFAAPDLEINHAQVPIRFCVVSYDVPTTVVFEQPANAFYSQNTEPMSRPGISDCSCSLSVAVSGIQHRRNHIL